MQDIINYVVSVLPEIGAVVTAIVSFCKITNIFKNSSSKLQSLISEQANKIEETIKSNEELQAELAAYKEQMNNVIQLKRQLSNLDRDVVKMSSIVKASVQAEVEKQKEEIKDLEKSKQRLGE